LSPLPLSAEPLLPIVPPPPASWVLAEPDELELEGKLFSGEVALPQPSQTTTPTATRAVRRQSTFGMLQCSVELRHCSVAFAALRGIEKARRIQKATPGDSGLFEQARFL
jgi:hypothetical protein